MINKISGEFGAFFLLYFTRELIRNSKQGAIFELKNIVKEKDAEIKREINRLIKAKKERNFEFEKSIMETTPSKITFEESSVAKNPFEEQKSKKSLAIPRQRFNPVSIPRRLSIPESRLPPKFQYLQPTPTNREIDLGKLNPFIQDNHVISIECYGANQATMVRVPELKKTSINFSQEEINQIIKKFSESARIPFHDGVFKVAFGRLILTANISNENCLNFVIRKIIQEQVFPR